MSAASLLADFIEPLTDACQSAPALDLACGNGRNGLYLSEQGVEVVFADRSEAALASVEESLLTLHGSRWSERASTWEVDFEVPGVHPLPEAAYGAILVFRYLHRPLFPAIAKALRPGGVLIYQTFTVGQREFGRPHNPDFLLREGELQDYFGHFNVLHYFEGTVQDQQSGELSAIAQLVAKSRETEP